MISLKIKKDDRRRKKNKKKKGSSEKKRKTYSVTVSYFTYKIDERLRYVAPQFG
jgi:hypothetical protein